MLGDFVYSNPTKLYFGRNAFEDLHGELKKYGKRVLLVYGGGSIKKNGIYDDIMKILQDEGKEVTELPGVMSNRRFTSFMKVWKWHERLTLISFWQLVAVLSSIMRRHCLHRFAVMMIPGKNISSAVKNRSAEPFLSA